ncbi:MAG: Ig-like domain-containing protein [Bacilli bacterium]
MKKVNRLILSLIAAIAFLPTSCEKVTDTSTSQVEKEVELILSNSLLTMTEDDQFVLTARLSNGEAPSLIWSSSDHGVVTVENGILTAICAGNAIITATDQNVNQSATCDVTVNPSAVYPSLVLSNNDLKILLGTEHAVTPTIKYNGKTVFTGFTIALTASNDKVEAKYEDGIIKLSAQKIGTTNINVEVTYKTKKSSKVLSVEVVEDVSFSLNQTESTLYTHQYDENYPSQFSLIPTVLENNVTITNPLITWTSDDLTVATVSDNGLVASVGVGEATITAKYTSGAEIEYVATCEVTVLKTTIDTQQNIDVFLDSADGSSVVDLASALGLPSSDDYKIYQGAEEVAVTGPMSALSFDLKPGCYALKAASKSLGVEFEFAVSIISKVIHTAEQLLNLKSFGTLVSESATKYKLEAYFVLGDDIDLAGQDVNTDFVNDATEEYGLVGGFDGKGHNIFGPIVKNGGLFGQIAEGSVVKNVAIIDQVVGYSTNGGIFGKTNYGTIDNCLVDVPHAPNEYSAISGFCNLNYGTISNSFVYYPNNSTSPEAKAVCQYNFGGTIRNVYAVTNDDVTYSTGGTVEVKKYAEGTLLANIPVTGLNDYWKLDGDRAEFVTTNAAWQTVRDNRILNLPHDQVTLSNGETFTLPEYPSYAKAEITDLAMEHATEVTLADDVITIADEIASDFTFNVKISSREKPEIFVFIPINVLKAQYLGKFDLFKEVSDGDMMLDAVSDLGLESLSNPSIKEGETLVAATFNGNQIDLSCLDDGEHSLALLSGGLRYHFEVLVITKVISSYADFTATRDAHTEGGIWSGYYIVGANFSIPTDVAYSSSVSTFNGIFDGRGHTITGGMVHAASPDATKSFFGRVAETSVIKNIAFKGTIIGLVSGIIYELKGTVDNCLFDCVRLGDTVYKNQSIIYHAGATSTISNSMFYLRDATSGEAGNDNGVIAMLGGTTVNVYVFSSKITGYDYRALKTGTDLYSYSQNLQEISDLTGFNAYWDLTDTKATFKSY